MKRDKKGFRRQDNSTSEEDSSSSSEDDENAELLTEELEEGFFKVLSHLKKKDSMLYEEGIKFFPGNSSEGDVLTDLNKGKTKKKSQKECREWLKGQKERIENEEVEDLEALHDFWTSPTLNKDEQFLRDYILNKKFLEPDDSFNIEEEINKLSDEEREVEEQLRFEHKYNCRFENPEQELVIKNKSKTERKKHKGGKTTLVHENDESLHHENSSSSEKVEISVGESKAEVTKKKWKKKSNKYKENKICESTEEDNEIENLTDREEDKETLTEDKHINIENNEVVSQADTYTITRKYKDGKSLKRKMNNSVQNSENKSTLNISSNVDINQPETLHPKKKLKKKINFFKIESSSMKKIRENLQVLPQDEQKRLNSLPRNLQMKNKKGINKLRHRNRKKALWMKTNNGVAEQTDGKITDPAVGINHKKIEKKLVFYNGHNKHVGGTKKQNNFQTKKNTHFQNIIVKERKNKVSKFSKMLSKKQKAAITVGKS